VQIDPAALPLTHDDIRYIKAGYVSVDVLSVGRDFAPAQLRTWIAGGQLPAAPYVLPDGTPMFPRDELALFDAAGGLDGTRALFARRFSSIAREYGEPAPADTIASEWESYLGGAYSICLREATPENIFRKERLCARLTALLAEPRPTDEAWRAELRDDVDALDVLERAFSPCDRIRFGRPSSRERFITTPRATWVDVFARGTTE